MKYLSLLLLSTGLLANAQQGGNAKSNGGSSTQTTNNGGQSAQGSSNGGMQAGGIANGGMNTGNLGAGTSTSGTGTSSAPGNAVSASNVPPGANPFLALSSSFPTLTSTQKTGLQMAATLWAQDTAVVSTALQLLGSGQMSDQDFRDAADMAYMAEVNELMQKNYIDALLGTMPQLQAASTSLGNGSFAIVVDQLREMRIRGPSNQTFVQAAVSGMNTLRCRQVLLAIDAYLQTANQAAGNNSFISATRPPACTQLYAQTADTLPAGSTVNATTFPTAQQLITQFNQPPRFMLSNSVAFSQTSGSDTTPALGSQYVSTPPFSNTSSLAGQLLAFQGMPVMTNGAASNALANPINAVLFQSVITTGNTASNSTTMSTTGTTSSNSTTPATGSGASTQASTGASTQASTGASTQASTGASTQASTGATKGGKGTSSTGTGANTNANAGAGGKNTKGNNGRRFRRSYRA